MVDFIYEIAATYMQILKKKKSIKIKGFTLKSYLQNATSEFYIKIMF